MFTTQGGIDRFLGIILMALERLLKALDAFRRNSENCCLSLVSVAEIRIIPEWTLRFHFSFYSNPGNSWNICVFNCLLSPEQVSVSTASLN